MPSKRNATKYGNTKDVGSKKSSSDPATGLVMSTDDAIALPVEMQQTVLNIFTSTFPTLVNDGLSAKIQQVKQHLFNRDFCQAFGSEILLEAYALRWSPSRALAYLDLFKSLPPLSSFLTSKVETAKSSSSPDDVKFLEVVCLGGGGGAELVALASLLHLQDTVNDRAGAASSTFCSTAARSPLIKCKLIDIADWSCVVQGLYASVTGKPPISQYASPVAKAANKTFITPQSFTADFLRQDLLCMKPDTTTAEIFKDATLVTLMFTLNELYTSSIKSTTNLLLTLTMLLQPGAMLLVVDSPGSYSSIKLSAGEDGNQDSSKRYPMQWLLDHTLLETASIGSSKNASSDQQWEKLESRESQWFRLGIVRYPIELEDMRYQVHLYRKLDSS